MNDTNSTVETVQPEVLDRMPAPVDQCSTTAMTVTDNPYMALAQQALASGKVDQLDRLLDLQIKYEADRARKAYTSAMAAFKAEPMEILKRKHVEFKTRDGDVTSYDHAELSDVADAVIPAMGKHGLSHRWDVKQEGGQITVACIISHRDGHSEEGVRLTAAPDGSGKKNAIQQVASTVTYLQRYTLLLATGMATKGMDDDGRGYGPVEDPEPDPALTPEQQEAAKEERKRGYFAEAYARNEDTMVQVKERIAFGDLQGAAAAWYDLSEKDQMALFIAPTKAGEHKQRCFTTAQREIIRTELSKYHPAKVKAND